MTTLTNNHNDQLFTELTPEEAAVIEGGIRIKLGRLTASSITYDDRKSGSDEPRLYNNGRKIWSGKGLKVGGKGLWIGKTVNVRNLKDLHFLEDDGRSNKDDYVGFKGIGKGLRTKSYLTFKGAGANYKLSFT